MPESAQIAVREPAAAEVKLRKPVKSISNARLNRAASELNMLSISSQKLKHVAAVGQFLNQLGLLRYGNGRLLGNAQLIAQGAQACAEMALKDNLTEETRQGYLDLQLRFIKALDENIALQLEVNKVAEQRSEPRPAQSSKSFLPGAQISPIQINVHGGTVETKEQPCKTS